MNTKTHLCMDGELTAEEQQANINAVKGTTVHVFNSRTGKWSCKTAQIVNYHPPLCWELDRSIYGTNYYHDNDIRTTNGRRLHELV